MERKPQRLFVKFAERQCLGLEANSFNFKRTFLIFKKHYKLVPLEVFHRNPYKTLISTVLSSRTRDETTLKVSKRLFKKATNIRKLDQLDESDIKRLIFPVGFYKTKARQLKLLAERILKEFRGKIPRNREDLMSLSGVGRKTANLVLNCAFGIPTIAVDTHVHRTSNLLGWVKTKTPEQTERQLTKVLPQKYWSDTNRFMVSIGQQYRSQKKLLEFLKKEDLI